jgi:nicotinamidase-related amidase
MANTTVHSLLTPDNCVVTFIDHQPQMLFGVANFDRQTVINNVVGFAKAAKAFNVPVVLSTVETKSFSGYIWPQLRAVFPEYPLYERTSMNAWEDKAYVQAIERTGRKKIVMTGLWTEVCITFPTIQAIEAGYEVYVVADCCGDITQMAHDMAMQRMIQAGAVPMTWIQTLLEWQRDWSRKTTYDAVTGIVREHGGAYGMGIEYAYTMVHGQTPSWEPKK